MKIAYYYKTCMSVLSPSIKLSHWDLVDSTAVDISQCINTYYCAWKVRGRWVYTSFLFCSCCFWALPTQSHKLGMPVISRDWCHSQVVQTPLKKAARFSWTAVQIQLYRQWMHLHWQSLCCFTVMELARNMNIVVHVHGSTPRTAPMEVQYVSVVVQ